MINNKNHKDTIAVQTTMNPQDANNQQPAPDYSFIMQQPAAVTKKKLDKKIVVLIAIVILTLLLVVIGSVFGKKSAKNSATTETPSPETQAVQRFMQNVKAGDKQAVSNSYATAPKGDIETEVIKPFVSLLNIGKCTYHKANTNTVSVVMSCPLNNSKKSMSINFELVKQSDVYKIDSFKAVSVL